MNSYFKRDAHLKMVHSLYSLVPSHVTPTHSSAAESRLYDMRERNILGESHLDVNSLGARLYVNSQQRKLFFFS